MPKILGVNIDSGSLNVSLIASTFRSVKHIKTERTVLPEGIEEKNSVMLEALTKWQKELMPAGVVIGLPLQNFSWRTIEMPPMKKTDMHNALYFELEKYLPLPMDEYLFDFVVTGSGKTAPNMVKVLVISIKKDILNGFLKIVIEAGMEILSVRCSTTDILCGVLDISGEKRLEGIFVNVTDDAYEIVGLHDSMPAYMKKVPKAVDVRDEIAALAMQFPGKVYVAGPMDQAVTSEFNSRKFQVLTPDLLASSYVKKTFLNLNFLPAEFIKEKKDYYPYIIGGLAAATVLIFLLTGMLAWYKDWRASTEIEAKVSAIKSKASGIIDAQKKLDLLQSDLGVLLEFQNKSNMTIRVLSTLSKTLPKDAWLMNLSIDDKGKVEMEGFTNKTATLVVALEKTKAFKNISFSAPIISKNNEERFALKMEVEGF
jgi:Tfp pilus assembly protein PilN